MHDIHLQSVDLNLLVVLDALLEHTSVTRAAERLGKTQSSVSHSLRKLREIFDDELLVRVGNEMRPTEHALALRVPLRQILTDVRGLFTSPGEFDPATYRRTFKIATTDFGEVAVIPGLLGALRQQAPGIDLVVLNTFDETEELVREGRVDMALGTNFRDWSGLVGVTLFEEHFECVMRPEHPAADALDLDAYVEATHALVTPRGLPGGMADTLLEERGRSRRVVIRTPHFLSAGHMVRQADLILTIPSQVAAVLTERFGLLARPCPLPMPTFRFMMIFGELLREHEGHAWFRDFVAERWRG